MRSGGTEKQFTIGTAVDEALYYAIRAEAARRGIGVSPLLRDIILADWLKENSVRSRIGGKRKCPAVS